MSQKDQPSINYPVCVIDETDELRTDFKIATFLTKQTRFLLILGKSSSRLYNMSTANHLWLTVRDDHADHNVGKLTIRGAREHFFEIEKVKSRL